MREYPAGEESKHFGRHRKIHQINRRDDRKQVRNSKPTRVMFALNASGVLARRNASSAVSSKSSRRAATRAMPMAKMVVRLNVAIFFFVDDDGLSSSSSFSNRNRDRNEADLNPDATQKLTFYAKILALLHLQSPETKVEAAKVATVATSTLGFAQSSFAAQPEEVVGNLAGIDGRIAIFFVFAPVLGWVAYNILGPGLSQLEDMQKKNSRRR